MWIVDSNGNKLHLWSSTSPASGSLAACGHPYNPQTCSKAGSSSATFCQSCFENPNPPPPQGQ